MTRNVGSLDGALRGFIGGMLLLAGTRRRSLFTALVGTGILFTALMRYCPMNDYLGIDTAQRSVPILPGTNKSVVEEASEESFPASDPPAFTSYT